MYICIVSTGKFCYRSDGDKISEALASFFYIFCPINLFASILEHDIR